MLTQKKNHYKSALLNQMWSRGQGLKKKKKIRGQGQ